MAISCVVDAEKIALFRSIMRSTAKNAENNYKNYGEWAYMKKEPRKMKDWCWINRQVIREHGKVLGANGIAVLTMIASCENSETKEAFPSISYISQNLGIGRQAVMRAIKMLDSLGYLERTKVNGRRTFYKLTTPTGEVILDSNQYHNGTGTSITTELPPVSPQYSNDTNITNIINDTVPVGTKPYFLAVNYFYKQYNTKYNTPYPVNRARYIKQMASTCPDLSFEILKKMVDKFLDGNGVDFQKFIWGIPELHASVLDSKQVKKHSGLSDKDFAEYYSQDAILKRIMNGEA